MERPQKAKLVVGLQPLEASEHLTLPHPDFSPQPQPLALPSNCDPHSKKESKDTEVPSKEG